MLVLSFVATGNSLSLNCEYIFFNWYLFPNSYTCRATVVFEGHGRNVEKVTGNHLQRMSNNDVIGLWIDQQRSVDFIPQNLMSSFPNIKLLTISSCGLKTISSMEMRQFGLKLEVLGFYENSIETIGFNLFQFNPNLRLTCSQ
jgi:hypothetical protein